MIRSNAHLHSTAAVPTRVLDGSRTAPHRWSFALVSLAAVAAVVAWSSPLAAQQTYTWSNTGGNSLWGTGSNWVGTPSPLTFNNQTNLVFDSASVQNRGNAMAIGGARTIRSLTINANYETASNATLDIRTWTTFSGSTAANLTFSATTGNASISVAQSTAGTVQVRLGTAATTSGGSVILNSNLDLAQNNTFFNATGFQFDGSVSGTGTINKTGAGVVGLVRDNSGWSGGMNINEGTVQVFASGNAFGSGTWSLGGGTNNTTLNMGSNVTYTNSGGLVVAAGAGSRTIGNMGTIISSGTGNPTLGGPVTLNKDATFSITQYTAGTHDRVTLSGAVTGTGGIVKTNTGILVFSGSGNNYSGTTDIQGGKLYLAGNGRLGSGAVTIASGANLDFATGTSGTNFVANNISGDGQIFQNLASTDTRFTGDVTNTGGLTINTGIVRIGNGGTTGSYTGNAVVSSGAQLVFARSDAYTYSGTISGSGNVVKLAAGDTTLTGNNSYSGQTSLFAGVLVADNANALGTGGNIAFVTGGGNTGTIRYTAASAGTDWASRIVNSAAPIRLDTAGNNVNLAGAIVSSNTNGLVKSGSGVLTLGGANTYTGVTDVNAGGLLVNGSLATTGLATVANGARIGGAGSLAGGLTIASGGLFVFNPLAALTVGGAVTLDNSFSVDSLVKFDGTGIDWGSIADGTYTLINTTSTFNNITNFGPGNAKDLGGGRSAYFQNGSLQLVVVPEPGALALAGLGVAAAAWARRRRA